MSRRRRAGGQATLEYVLLIMVLAGLIFGIGTSFNKRIQVLLENAMDNRMRAYFQHGGAHTFNLGR